MDQIPEDTNEFDVNKYRKSWEIEDHWILRRDFILCHLNKFSFDRLLCLAQTFVNIETLQNELILHIFLFIYLLLNYNFFSNFIRYDPKLMEQISQLAKDVKSYQEFCRKRKKPLE